MSSSTLAEHLHGIDGGVIVAAPKTVADFVSLFTSVMPPSAPHSTNREFNVEWLQLILGENRRKSTNDGIRNPVGDVSYVLLVKKMTAAAEASLPVPAREALSTAAQPMRLETTDLEGLRVQSR